MGGERLFRTSFVLGLVLLVMFPAGPRAHAQAAKDRPKIEVIAQIGHSDLVMAVAFSRDGRLVLSGSADKTLKLWDVASGALVRSFVGHSDTVRSVAFSPDARHVLSGSADKTLKLWDAASGALLRTLEGHSDVVNSVAFSLDGRLALSGSADKTLKLWDAATGALLRTFEGHSKEVTSVTFSPNGRHVLSGSADKTLKLWDATTGAFLRTFKGHSKKVTSVAFSPNGRQVLSGSGDAFPSKEDNTLKLWDAASGALLRTFEGHSYAVTSVAFSPDGRHVLSGMTGSLLNDDNTLKLWDVASGAQLGTFAGHREGVTSVAFSPDRRQELSGITLGTPWQVLSGTTRGTLELRATATGELLRTFTGHSERVALVAFSSDRRQVLLSAGLDTIKLRDAVTGALLRTFTHSGWIYSVAFSPDGRQVLSGSTDGTLKLWDVASGAPLRTIRAHSEGVMSVAFSPDGRRVLSGSRGSFGKEDDTLKLWDAASGALLRTMAGSRNQADSVAFSPDGRLVLAGGQNPNWMPFRNDAIAALELWDATTGALLHSFEGHSRDITAVAFSPNGRQVLSGSNDKTLRLWDATAGALLRTFTGHSERVTSVAFSSDGRQVLSGSADKTLKLWDAASGALLRTFEGHSDRVSSVAFSSDGRQVISVSLDGITGIWNRATGELVANSLATPQGEWLAMTPAGFIASSRSVSDLLSIVRGLNVVTIDQVHQSLFNPDLVREALAGDPEGEVAKAAKVMNLKDVLDSGPAPSVVITYPSDNQIGGYPPFRGGHQSAAELIVATALVEDRGSGVGRIEWRVNGITAAVAVGPPPDQQGPIYGIQQKLALDPGNNSVEVIAYNRRNLLASLPTRATVQFTEPAKKIRPNLHILAIGVNRYADEKFAPPLDLAEQDAKAFANSMKKAAGGLYGEVRVAQVLGSQATLANLTGVVDRIAADIHPRDTFILFAAGHGVSSNGRFYLIPQNYRSGAASLADGAIGQDQLQDWLANRIKAKRALILLDTCESGALIAGHTSSRVDAPASEAAVGRLHEATGRPVLTAAAKGQSAWEPGGGASGENHSVFTWALLDALRKADTNGNGLIELSELVGHVQSVVPRIAAGIGSADPQTARFGSHGEDFAVARRLP